MKIVLTADEYIAIVNHHDLVLLTTTEVVVDNQDTTKTDIISFDYTNHIFMWLWLSENPEKDKEDWPEWQHNGGAVKTVCNLCFACEYAKQMGYRIDSNRDICKYCPFGDFKNEGCLGRLLND